MQYKVFKFSALWCYIESGQKYQKKKKMKQVDLPTSGSLSFNSIFKKIFIKQPLHDKCD